MTATKEEHFEKVDVLVAIMKTAEKEIYDFLDGREFVNSDVLRQTYRESETIWDNVIAGKASIEDYKNAMYKWKIDVIDTFKKTHNIIDTLPIYEPSSQPKKQRRQLVY